jgi:hypothetical protein
MGKSSSGPEWTDILTSMAELERAHDCIVSLDMRLAGTIASPQLYITAYAFSGVMVSLSGAPYVAVQGVWPHHGWKTFEGLVYKLMLELDHEISAGWYQQEKLEI